MPIGAQAILLALLIMLAIIVVIVVYFVRRYRNAPPEKRLEMNETFKRSAFMGGGIFIVLGGMSMFQEAPYQGGWWYDAGCVGLGVLLLIASVVGIPSRADRGSK